MAPRDILTRPSRRPDRVLRYGERTGQIADLRLPPQRDGDPGWLPSWPLVVFLHGGFWRTEFDRAHAGPLGDALASSGFVVCTPEFRRTGQPGGGWPGTFDDVATAVDILPGLVARELDGVATVGPVVLAGHSAGGHLAGGRPRGRGGRASSGARPRGGLGRLWWLWRVW